MNDRVRELESSRARVRCICGHDLFDGIVIKSRVVRVLPRGGAEALCRCKRWLPVPVTYQAVPVPPAVRGHAPVAAVG